MALSDLEIMAEMDAGRLKIDPAPGERIGPSSVDLLLGPSLYVLPSPDEVEGVTVDPSRVNVQPFFRTQHEHRLDRDGPFRIAHGQVVIGKTLETIELPAHLAGRIEGKSSLARFGLAVHITAPTIQAGFRGTLILEMYNIGPWTLELTAGMPIAQVIFEHLGLPPRRGYEGQFQNQA